MEDRWQQGGCTEMLVDMGFDRGIAEQVLHDSGGDLSAAVAILLSASGGPDHAAEMQQDAILGAGMAPAAPLLPGGVAGAAGGAYGGGGMDLHGLPDSMGGAADSELEEAIRLSQLEEERRMKQEAFRMQVLEEERKRRQQESTLAFASGAPSLPSAIASPSASSRMPQQRKAPVGSSPPTAGARLLRTPQVLQMGAAAKIGVSTVDRVAHGRGGKKRPGPLVDPLSDPGVSLDDLDNWPESSCSMGGGSLSGGAGHHAAEASDLGLRRAAHPPAQLQQLLSRSRPGSTPGSRGSGGRPESSGTIGIEDLDHWTCGAANTSSMSSLALLPEIRRKGGSVTSSSSAPRLFGASPGPSPAGAGGGKHGGMLLPPGFGPHGGAASGGGGSAAAMLGGAAAGHPGMLLLSPDETLNATRVAAMVAAAGARPPSRAGMPNVPRGGFSGSGPGRAGNMNASRSAPLLSAVGATLTYEGPGGSRY